MVVVATHEADVGERFTADDMDRLPGLPGAKHELFDGVYVISSKARFLDVEDLALLGHVPGAKRELLDGVIEMVPAPSARHQGASWRLSGLLRDAAAASDDLAVRAAPFDVFLARQRIIQPDLLVARRDQIRLRGIEGPPVLAVEILSPSTRAQDLGPKRQWLEAAGCPSYWLLDPGEHPTLTVLELVAGAYVEVAVVAGAEAWTATQPFEVTIVPADLVD